MAGIPFAFGSALYTGGLFSTTSQPGWKDARWLGGYMTHSAVALGSVEMLAIASILGHRGAIAALRPATIALHAINLLFAGLLAFELRPSIRPLEGGRRLELTAAVGAVVGVLFPALLFLAGGGLLPVLTASVLILAGNFLYGRRS